MFFQVQELASTDILLCEMEMPPARIIVSAKEFWRKNKKRKKVSFGILTQTNTCIVWAFSKSTYLIIDVLNRL